MRALFNVMIASVLVLLIACDSNANEDCSPGICETGIEADSGTDDDVVFDANVSTVCAEDDRPAALTCGDNNNGTREYVCDDANWVPSETCNDLDVCTDGAKQLSDDVCGYDGRYEEECVEGTWQFTTSCIDFHADDAELMAEEQAQTLSFSCFAPALNTAEIFERFQASQVLWTPRPPESMTTGITTIRTLSRRCNSLTGCENWTFVVGLDLNAFYLGYYFDEDGQQYLWQGKSEPAGAYRESLLPVSSGLATATLSTDELNFGAPERFLVKVTDGCFSLSTLVKKTINADGSWKEEVSGAQVLWNWTNPVQPDPAPPVPPLLSDADCPQEATTPAEIAQAWFSAGSTQVTVPYDDTSLGGHVERTCTPFTSCSDWSSELIGGATLYIENGAVRIGSIPVEADGSFSETTLSSEGQNHREGYITPNCIRYKTQSTVTEAGSARTWERHFDSVLRN